MKRHRSPRERVQAAWARKFDNPHIKLRNGKPRYSTCVSCRCVMCNVSPSVWKPGVRAALLMPEAGVSLAPGTTVVSMGSQIRFGRFADETDSRADNRRCSRIVSRAPLAGVAGLNFMHWTFREIGRLPCARFDFRYRLYFHRHLRGYVMTGVFTSVCCGNWASRCAA